MVINEFVLKTIVPPLVKEGIATIKKIIENSKVELIVTQNDLETSIYEHNQFVINTTKSISFKDLKGNKNLNDVYIDLDILLEPRRNKFIDENDEKKENRRNFS